MTNAKRFYGRIKPEEKEILNAEETAVKERNFSLMLYRKL